MQSKHETVIQGIPAGFFLLPLNFELYTAQGFPTAALVDDNLLV